MTAPASAIAPTPSAASPEPPQRTELELQATRALPRRLFVWHCPGTSTPWRASLYPPGAHTAQLVYVSARNDERPPRLCLGPNRYVLWIGHTAFEVSEAEARCIRETFEPYGLDIEAPEPDPVPSPEPPR